MKKKTMDVFRSIDLINGSNGQISGRIDARRPNLTAQRMHKFCLFDLYRGRYMSSNRGKRKKPMLKRKENG